jgi:hypothetical protein
MARYAGWKMIPDGAMRRMQECGEQEHCKTVADGIVRMKEGLIREQCAVGECPWRLFAIPIQLPEARLTSGFVLVQANSRAGFIVASIAVCSATVIIFHRGNACVLDLFFM